MTLETMEELRAHLEQVIVVWREEKAKAMAVPPDPRKMMMCSYYIDAYQSVYTSCFGELYPKAKEQG